VALEALVSSQAGQIALVSIGCSQSQCEAQHYLLDTPLVRPHKGHQPGATIAFIAGIKECSQSSFNGKQGTVAVPGFEPVTLQSTKYGIPLGYFIAAAPREGDLIRYRVLR
jgi:hypothetical protein